MHYFCEFQKKIEKRVLHVNLSKEYSIVDATRLYKSIRKQEEERQ